LETGALEPAGEVVVVHDRELPQPTEALKDVPADEDRRVPVVDAEATGEPVVGGEAAGEEVVAFELEAEVTAHRAGVHARRDE